MNSVLSNSLLKNLHACDVVGGGILKWQWIQGLKQNFMSVKKYAWVKKGGQLGPWHGI
jgi:hypothetical protein